MVKEFGFGIERETIPVKKRGGVWQATGYLDPPTTAIPLSGDRNYGLKVGNTVFASWHHDTSVQGVELQSGRSEGTDWKNKSIKKAVAEIKLAEKELIKRIGTNAVIMPFGTVGEDDEHSQYHGSYHFSFTLPRSVGRSEEDRQKNIKKHEEFMRQIQWIEPLLMCKIGSPRPSSVEDAGKEPEGSERTAFGWGGALAIRRQSIKSQPPDGNRGGGESNWWRKEVKPSTAVQRNSYVDFRNRNLSNFGSFEMRFTDTFDSRFLKDYAKVLALLSQNEPIDSSLEAYEDDDVGNAMARVMEEGHNAYVPKEYVDKLQLALNLNFTPKEKKIRRANDLTDLVVKKIYEKNKNSEDAKLLIGEREITEPKLFNINGAGYNFFYRKKLRENEAFKKKHLTLIQGLALIDTTASNGEITAGTQGKGIKHILEKIAGKSLSDEDTRDFIDFLEDYGLIKANRNEDDSIDSIKLLYSSPEEGKTKLEAVIADDSFYSGKAPEPTLENYETDEELKRTIGTRARIARALTTRVTEVRERTAEIGTG